MKCKELVTANLYFNRVEESVCCLYDGKMFERLFQIENRVPVMCHIRNRVILFLFFWLIFRTDKGVIARPIYKQLPFSENIGDTKKSSNESVSRTPDETDWPSETQKAVCTVTAGDVKAQAEAVTTKMLKGVCGSNEMHDALNKMETRLTNELNNIINLLNSLNSKGNYDREAPSGYNTSTQKLTLNPIPYESKFIDYKDEDKLDKNNVLKYKSLSAKESVLAPIRETEILVYNNTFYSEKNLNIYSYYWKIENFTQKIESAVTIESATFSIKGKTFKVKAYFQHLHRDFLFFQLEDASHHTTKNSIILDTGGLFKEIENDSFKYKISVLGQNEKQSKDLVSQEFGNHEAGFLIPNSALLDSPFIKDDSLLIKIVLYL